ncbi:uncharacterized protein LOC116114999 [Pistacia vera]|uniref:uncharacterized protein LOC116114999 n=1 Tax=Pistacia vera TaxID=55513 RepID=UPI001262BD88|nr:uncharacterized protein LOC116114999 [Pistacia vera]
MADFSSNSSPHHKSNKDLVQSRQKHNSYLSNLTCSTTISSNTLPVINPKLTRDNHRFWKSQILFAVGAHDLEDHLTRLISCPTPFIRVQSAGPTFEVVKKPNPEFHLWKKTDKLLVSWLLSSISESIFSLFWSFSFEE